MNRPIKRENIIDEVVCALDNIKKKRPQVYHLTNMVTINDCANITLAIGGAPIMSFCIEEIEEIIEGSSSVVLNIGTMDRAMSEMALEVGKIANRLEKPIVLDPVGVGVTKARKKLVTKLLQEVKFSVIKGNMAEIKTLLDMEIKSKGVDSLEKEERGDEIAKLAAEKFLSTIVVTGETDYIASESQEIVVKIKNGHRNMRLVTGTGCMISSLIGCFLGGGNNSFISAVSGVLIMGIAGELASVQCKGTGELKVLIMDSIFNINKEMIESKSKIATI